MDTQSFPPNGDAPDHNIPQEMGDGTGNNFNNPMAFGRNLGSSFASLQQKTEKPVETTPTRAPQNTVPTNTQSTTDVASTDATRRTTTTVGPTQSSPSATQRLLDAINGVRRENGLKELVLDPSLSEASSKNNQVSLSTGVLGHHNGLINGSGGEITYGGPSTTDADADAAVAAWLSSPGHRGIMLGDGYTKFGADITNGYATANFA